MVLPRFAVAAAALPGTLATAVRLQARDGEQPSFPYDPKTTKYCSFWLDNDGTLSCQEVASTYVTGTKADFLRWNPSITPDCGNFLVGHSYCIEALGEPASTTTSAYITTTATDSTTLATLITSATSIVSTKPPFSSTIPSTTTSPTTATTTTTAPGNVIATPSPTQPGMVDNCNLFYFVKTGETCQGIADKNGVSLSDFASWNNVSSSASCPIWANVYVCVNIIGRQPSPTKPDNGIPTPSPVQPGIVDSCNKFYFVKQGQSCGGIASESGISSADFLNWNPKSGTDCSGLWSNTYACVSVIGNYNFNDGKLPGWTIYDGSFDAKSNALVAASSSTGKASLNTNFNDFTLEADIIMPTGTKGNAGLMFRASNFGAGTNTYQGYYAGITFDGYVILGRANKDWTQIGSATLAFQAGKVYHVKVQASGDVLSVYVDDMIKPKISVSDGTYRSGTNGVRVWQSGATFDNIKIAPMVYEDFSKNLVGWTIYDGSFDAGSHALVAGSSSTGKASLNTYFSDFTIEADITLPTGTSGNGGLVFRASNLGMGTNTYKGYYAGITYDGYVILGHATNNWVQISSAPISAHLGKPYHVMVQARGDAIIIFVDDMLTPKITVKDSTYSTGLTGVRVWQSGATFDNLKITPIQAS